MKWDWTSNRGSGPLQRTITGGAESADRKQELGRTESGGGDLQSAAELFSPVAESDSPRRTETGSGFAFHAGREFEPRCSSMGNANIERLEGRIMSGSRRTGERIAGSTDGELAESTGERLSVQ